METLLITFGFFIAVIFAMSIGFIIKGKTIKGSCGGITALGMKKMCDCEEPCDNLKAKIADGTADPEEVARFRYYSSRVNHSYFVTVNLLVIGIVFDRLETFLSTMPFSLYFLCRNAPLIGEHSC